jgi:hypothetical protein
MTIGLTTRLSDLQTLVQMASHASECAPVVPERMLRSVEQSMRVEGYAMSREELIATVEHSK